MFPNVPILLKLKPPSVRQDKLQPLPGFGIQISKIINSLIHSLAIVRQTTGAQMFVKFYKERPDQILQLFS